MTKRLLIATIACLTVTAAARADEPKFVSLFDGKTLKGWKVHLCDAEVKDGAIFLKGGNGIVHTEKRYGDFILEVEWKALRKEKWDSGIYFRSELPAGSRPWPNRYQANLAQGKEGNVARLKGAASTGLCKDGQWNTFRLKVVGGTAELHINGKPAWKVGGVKNPNGYICLQCEVPGGGQFLFKNIRIAELSKPQK